MSYHISVNSLSVGNPVTNPPPERGSRLVAVATDRLSETGQRRQRRAAVLTDSGRAEMVNRFIER